MQITLNGKRIYPPQREAWLFRSTVIRETDGAIVYTEYPANEQGKPDKDNPTLVVEIDKDLVERLVGLLVESQPKETPESLRKRAEILEASQRVDEISKAQGLH